MAQARRAEQVAVLRSEEVTGGPTPTYLKAETSLNTSLERPFIAGQVVLIISTVPHLDPARAPHVHVECWR